MVMAEDINADYDFNVNLRSQILAAIEDLGFTVPYEIFESSDDIVKWLVKLVNDPAKVKRGE